MSDPRDEHLESMLRSRHQEAASADLAGRIILQAQTLPQIQNLSLWQSLRQMFAEFHLPKPAYVLASALALGLVLGFSTAPDTTPTQDRGVAITQTMIAGDEGLL
ncbi:MAG TPA: hypothetical protein VMT22_06085 [Terriglobales bacterium]|nr:hypothetical protein [Terriglobales bacterium]